MTKFFNELFQSLGMNVQISENQSLEAIRSIDKNFDGQVDRGELFAAFKSMLNQSQCTPPPPQYYPSPQGYPQSPYGQYGQQYPQQYGGYPQYPQQQPNMYGSQGNPYMNNSQGPPNMYGSQNNMYGSNNFQNSRGPGGY